jgi:HAD superfamily hydrolase (TIGR01509 family)
MTFLIFDMDGVLVDTSAGHARAYHELWERCGVAGPPYSQIAGRPTREVVEQFTRELVPTPAAIEEWAAFKQQRARLQFQAGTLAFDDVVPCLNAIHRAGIAMGVATGASRETAELLLDRAGITGFFQFLLTSEDVRRGKPEPEVYQQAGQLALKISGANADQTVVVEDSDSGLRAAAAAGAKVACVRSGLRISSPGFLGSFHGLVDFACMLGVTVE